MGFWKIRSTGWIKINCVLTTLIVLLLALHTYKIFYVQYYPQKATKSFSVCCAYPCKNGGTCSSQGMTYMCNCKSTHHYGKNCELSTLFEKLKRWYYSRIYNDQFLTIKFDIFWRLVNSFSAVRSQFNLKLLYANKFFDADFVWNMDSDYLLEDELYQNASFNLRTLPPVPKNCPTPMGLSGPMKLPDINELYKRVLKRVRLKVCPLGTNIFFGIFSKHFLSQFNYYNWLYSDDKNRVNNMLDMSHVYGKDQSERLSLRSFKKGRLKSKVINGEEYPPTLDRCPKLASKIKANTFKEKTGSSYIEPKWAIGNPALGINPLMFVLSTIWLREHNRVCEILAEEHHSWSDEQLYQTAKLIITGEAIKIMITEFLQHLTQYQLNLMYEPKLTHKYDVQYSGKVPQELFYLPLWHTFLPDEIVLNENRYNIEELSFMDVDVVFENGMGNLIHAMTQQRGGEFIVNNIGKGAMFEIEHIIKQTREARIQSYNNYRRKFNLKPAETFEELTGDLHLAAVLKELYLDIDAVELVVGLLVEDKPKEYVVPPSMVKMGMFWLSKTLISHPINSPKWWTPSTFGGKVGFDIVKTANLQKLICLNVKEKCQNMYVNFKIPNESIYLQNYHEFLKA